MVTYEEALSIAMKKLMDNPNTIFIGQQTVFYGNPMSKTISHLNTDRMIETPVFEDTQMGMSLGIAMTGKLVVSFYPRWDFLILAMNQLVNHVDKFKLMTGNNIHMIIRVGKGSDIPLDPGHQHKGNYFNEVKGMCSNIHFMDCKSTDDIHYNYNLATNTPDIYVINEYPQMYNL